MEYLAEIRQFIAKDSPFQARRVCNILRKAIVKLRKHPEFGDRLPESENPGMREISVFNYRIIYRWNEKENSIRILAIMHGARLLDEEMLEE